MPKKVHLADMLEPMQAMLKSGGTVNFNTNGTSMLPMLHNKGDRVILKQADEPLKKYDLPLYQRADGAFVLHRVVKAEGTTYTMCGDNQYILEKGVDHSQIIGVVTQFVRKGKTISVDNKLYIIYSRIWVFTRPLRAVYIKLRSLFYHLRKSDN